jgi:rubredoxin
MSNTKYKCNICNYIYDPDEGDLSNGIASGTTFEEVPGYWTCPVCGAPKSEFVVFA